METDPVFGSDFFGRDDTLQILGKRVQAFLKGYRQNIGIVGKKSIGKSSLIQHFVFNIKEPSLIPIYIKVLAEPFDYFAQKFMGALLAGFLEVYGEKVPVEFNALIKRTKRLLPRTLKKMRQIKRILAKEDGDLAFQEILSLTRLLQEESGKKVLLALDNFDKLGDLLLKNPFDTFGNAIMMQKDTLYLVSASRIQKAQSIFHEKLALLFGNFEILELKSFDFATCQAYLEQHLPGVKIADGVKKFIVELTDGHPYFLEIITERIRQLLKEEKEVSLTDHFLARALGIELYKKKGCLHQYFVMLLHNLGRERAFQASLKVLLAISLGYKKVHHIASYLHRKRDEVKKILAKLLEDEVVEKRGSFFIIQLPLFGFWLRHVYYERELDFIHRDNLSIEAFHQKVSLLIQARAEEEKKELTKRVEELFRRFQNDLVELESKKIMCPHFHEVSFKPSNGRVFPVEAKAVGTRWVCQVAYKSVTEDDVRSFIQDLQKLRRKVQRKIIIALQGMELNATLLAKEAKIMLWSLKDLNSLLHLYDQPKVIV